MRPMSTSSRTPESTEVRPLLIITVTALASVCGTLFLLWATMAGKFMNREDVRQLMEDASPFVHERSALWSAVNASTKLNEEFSRDLKQLVRDVGLLHTEQARMTGKIDEILRTKK